MFIFSKWRNGWPEVGTLKLILVSQANLCWAHSPPYIATEVGTPTISCFECFNTLSLDSTLQRDWVFHPPHPIVHLVGGIKRVFVQGVCARLQQIKINSESMGTELKTYYWTLLILSFFIVRKNSFFLLSSALTNYYKLLTSCAFSPMLHEPWNKLFFF